MEFIFLSTIFSLSFSLYVYLCSVWSACLSFPFSLSLSFSLTHTHTYSERLSTVRQNQRERERLTHYFAHTQAASFQHLMRTSPQPDTLTGALIHKPEAADASAAESASRRSSQRCTSKALRWSHKYTQTHTQAHSLELFFELCVAPSPLVFGFVAPT